MFMQQMAEQSEGIIVSQIASFYLIEDEHREELSSGDCSGEVYMAIWDYCESELDIDGRFNAPENEDVLDCVEFDGEMAEELLTALQERNPSEAAAEIAPDWDLPVEAVQRGLETILSHLKRVKSGTALLYEMV